MNNTIRMIVLSSLTAALEFLSLPLSSVADREYIYKNCAGLQKVINDRNPSLIIKGFEKVQMMRKNHYATYGTDQYMIFCNGGIVIDKLVGTVCRGYIGYSFARVAGISDYYADWGEVRRESNLSDNNKGNYCRFIK